MAADTIVCLKITLDHAKPAVLRHVEVPFDIRLDRLHLTIQAAMGWTNSHLYEIRAGDVRWSTPNPDADWNVGEFRPVPGGPVMLAVERNDAARTAVDTAKSLAQVFKRTLIVVHARGSAEASAILNPGATRLEDFGLTPGAELPMQMVLKDGSPADAVAQAIEQHKPSILVVGVKRRSDTPGRHGTVFALLAASRVPVLCIPAEAASAGQDQGEQVSVTHG